MCNVAYIRINESDNVSKTSSETWTSWGALCRGRQQRRRLKCAFKLECLPFVSDCSPCAVTRRMYGNHAGKESDQCFPQEERERRDRKLRESKRDTLRDFIAALCYFGAEPTRKAMLAAWWFIENVDQHEPARTELFFKVRELVREAT
jgi:hypothetical protein